MTDLKVNPINLYHSEKEKGETHMISYGSGNISGTETEDVITFFKDQELTNSNSFTLPFLELHQTDIDGLNQSGLIGLGFNSLKSYDSKTFLDAAVDAGLIKDKKFMFNMANTN